MSVGLAQGGVQGWWLGLLALGGRLALTVAVAVGLRLMAQERSARLTALFAGVALLLALAGGSAHDRRIWITAASGAGGTGQGRAGLPLYGAVCAFAGRRSVRG